MAGRTAQDHRREHIQKDDKVKVMINEAATKLQDTTFLLGIFRRKAAIKSLSGSSDPKAAEMLVEAVDKGNPDEKLIKEALFTTTTQEWIDCMWHIWTESRQAWLEDLLVKKGIPSKREEEKIISLLKLGSDQLALNRSTALEIIPFRADTDRQIREASSKYFQTFHRKNYKIWMEVMLLAKDFDAIGNDRNTAEGVMPFLLNPEENISKAAESYFDWLPLEAKVPVYLKHGLVNSLPLEDSVAWEVIPFINNSDKSITHSSNLYVQRVKKNQPPFYLRFMTKAHLVSEIPVKKKLVSDAFRLLSDEDNDIKVSAVDYIASLPLNQVWNDIIVDEWISTGSTSLEKLLIEQGRLPSDSSKEALLFLVTGRVKAYMEMKDKEGTFFIDAFAMASTTMRQRINTVVIESKNSQLAGVYRKAMEGGKGLDTGLALRALMASGNEDGLVDATKNLNIEELIKLCERWAKNDRRPNDRKKAMVVERALLAYKRLGNFEIEPVSLSPPGIKDIFEIWNSTQLTDKEIRQDLESEDPFSRARGLFLGNRRGIVDHETLHKKAGSKDWPERFITALLCPDISFKNDHVFWVKVCSEFDAELFAAKVECDPYEYERCESMKESLKKGGALAARSLALLEILQSFRTLFIGGLITVSDDDSAKEEGAIEVIGEEISRDDLTF